jgi:hypothetical protein
MTFLSIVLVGLQADQPAAGVIIPFPQRKAAGPNRRSKTKAPRQNRGACVIIVA